jgi:hypothetical protein
MLYCERSSEDEQFLIRLFFAKMNNIRIHMSSERYTSSNTEQYKYHVRFQVLIAESLGYRAEWAH